MMWMRKGKALCVLLAAALALPLAACGGADAEWENTWGGISLLDFAALAGEMDRYTLADLKELGSYVFEEGDHTLRGVELGDSPEKVAALYSGIECAVMDGTDPDEEDGEYTELYTDFAAYLGGEALGRGSVGLTYVYYIVGGHQLGLEQFRAYAASGEDVEGAEGYSLTFLFQRGKVSGIYLDYARVGSMIEEVLEAE